MNRRLATALASAAFVAFTLAPAPADAAQAGQALERTGRRATKAVTTSCPRHPEVKARSAAKCPKCRIQARGRNSARQKDNVNAANGQTQEGTLLNEQ